MKTAAYWIATGLVALVMAVSGGIALARGPAMAEKAAHLGYPPYFLVLLGVAKLLGVAVLLAPSLARMKEWAYAGFGIVLVSASVSHFASGDGAASLEPLLFLALLVASYRTRPGVRRLA